MTALSESRDVDHGGIRSIGREPRAPLISFSLRTLLLLMALAAVGCFFISKYYVVHRARFEILETDVALEEGSVNGAVSVRCSRLNDLDNIEYADVVIYIQNISDTRVLDLKEGDEFFVRYRHNDFGPVKAQNRYFLFMDRELGIRRDEIDYFVEYSGWGEFHVSGKSH